MRRLNVPPPGGGGIEGTSGETRRGNKPENHMQLRNSKSVPHVQEYRRYRQIRTPVQYGLRRNHRPSQPGSLHRGGHAHGIPAVPRTPGDGQQLRTSPHGLRGAGSHLRQAGTDSLHQTRPHPMDWSRSCPSPGHVPPISFEEARPLWKRNSSGLWNRSTPPSRKRPWPPPSSARSRATLLTVKSGRPRSSGPASEK